MRKETATNFKFVQRVTKELVIKKIDDFALALALPSKIIKTRNLIKTET